jgi:glucose-1-phosphate thymidylyltransferase
MTDSHRELKGLILSGGKGSRLRPFTYTGAKQLVPIANKPILFYALESLAEAGVRRVGIVVGDTREQVMAAVGDGSHFGLEVTYIEQPVPLCIAQAVEISEGFLGSDPFVLYLGDNFLRGGIVPFVEEFRRSSPQCLIMLRRVPNPQDFGVARLVDGRVAGVVEKPKEPPSDLAVIGIYMFDRRVFEAVNNIKPSARGELEITDTIQYLIDKGCDVRHRLVGEQWIDTGKMEDILEANRLILETLETRVDGCVDERSKLHGVVVLEKGCRIVNSVIRGPSIIGEETEIIDSFVGSFTSVYHHSTIRDSEVANCIILENTVIENMGQRIEDSLIGRNVAVYGSNRLPRSYRLVLGDFSQVCVP